MSKHLNETGRHASEMSVMRLTVVVVLLTLLTSACANRVFDIDRTETVLPLSRAWIDGRIVEYVTTDISDLAMATMMGANYVPRLSEALNTSPGHSLVERVYKFPNNEQISVFQSAPNPVGSTNQDLNYSPLWRVVQVRWTNPAIKHELKSEEDVLAAEERQELVLEVTEIVVNCPVTRMRGVGALKGVR